ncbi:MAG: hypothetical protein FD150_214, partial [Rhodobacteraceae bacterium]
SVIVQQSFAFWTLIMAVPSDFSYQRPGIP